VGAGGSLTARSPLWKIELRGGTASCYFCNDSPWLKPLRSVDLMIHRSTTGETAESYVENVAPLDILILLLRFSPEKILKVP
jgi:hypothetical protein